MLEFHRRESKPLFWRLFDRLGLDDIELFNDLDCLTMYERTDRESFKFPPKARNLSYEYRFNPEQEFKGTSSDFYVLGVATSEGKNLKVGLVAEESDLENGLIVLKAKDEPPTMVSLIPYKYISTIRSYAVVQKTSIAL